MPGGSEELEQSFAAFVRDHGERHLRVAVLLTGDWHAAEDLVQASLIKLYQAWPRVDLNAATSPDVVDHANDAWLCPYGHMQRPFTHYVLSDHGYETHPPTILTAYVLVRTILIHATSVPPCTT